MIARIAYRTTVLALLVLSTACSFQTTKPERKVDIRPSLEVPPDLVTPEVNNSLIVPEAPLGETPSGGAAASTERGMRPELVIGEPVLPSFDGLRMERAGGQRWLVVNAAPVKMWDLAHQFLQRKGLTVAYESRQAGIIETDWADYRPRVGDTVQRSKGVLGLLHSSGLRDKYRIRLERGKEPNTTEVYLSHRGMEEVVASNNPTGVIQTQWQRRPSDPELEAEMLRQFLVYVGVSEQRATNIINAKPEADQAAIVTDASGAPVLRVQDSLENTWRRLGLSLDRLGWVVEARDSAQWTYKIRHVSETENKKKRGGLFGWLIGDDEQEAQEATYLVSLRDTAAWTEVVVRDEKGLPVPRKLADGLLAQLQQQLR